MNVKEFYESIGGNYSKALETMMFDGFIIKMLNKFLQSTTYNDLLEASKPLDIPHIFNVTHMLKGVAGNLALTPLQQKAAQVCEMTREASETNTENISKDVDELINIYKLIIDKIPLLG